MVTSEARDEQGREVSRHPLTKIDKIEGDDVTEDLEVLRAWET